MALPPASRWRRASGPRARCVSGSSRASLPPCSPPRISAIRRAVRGGKAGPVVVFVRNRLCLLAKPGLEVDQADPLAVMLDPAIKLGTSTPKTTHPATMPGRCSPRPSRSSRALRRPSRRRPCSSSAERASPSRRPDATRRPGTWPRAARICSCPIAPAARSRRPSCLALQVLELPDALAVGADYGLAVLNGPPEQQAAAGAFAMFILSPAGQDILARWGFRPVTAPASDDARSLGEEHAQARN